jgi:hypothetical protein
MRRRGLQTIFLHSLHYVIQSILLRKFNNGSRKYKYQNNSRHLNTLRKYHKHEIGKNGLYIDDAYNL